MELLSTSTDMEFAGMPQDQGSSVTNSDYIADLMKQINNCEECGELQRLADEAMAYLKSLLDGIGTQTGDFSIIEQLMQIPHDLGSVISWIGNMIEGVIKPLYKPYLTYILQLQDLVSEIAALTSAIEGAASRLVNCSVTITAPTVLIPAT